MNSMNDMRKYATINEHEISNSEATDFPHNYHQIEDNWDFNEFVKNFKIKIIAPKVEAEDPNVSKIVSKCSSESPNNRLEFDMIGVSPAIANAFRRILIAEVPTMAIEKVFVYNNTSIFQDEFLAHRLGLIPIKADPRFFEYRQEDDNEGTPQDTIVLNLKVKCVKNKNATPDTTLPEELYENRLIYTKDLKWEPIGSQADIFSDTPIKPVDDDILIAKLALGHELDLKMHCVKGVGKDHTKFSPVSTASYRLLPQIELLKEVEGEDADKLKECFSDGVIHIIQHSNGKRVAKVVNARIDSGSRNVFRYPQFKDKVKISLVKDHFIFNVESTGALPAHQLVTEAIEILIGKCRHFLGELEEYHKKGSN